MRNYKIAFILMFMVSFWLSAAGFAQNKKSKSKTKRKAVAAKKTGVTVKAGNMKKLTVTQWGGQGVGLSEADAGEMNVEFDCAHGVIKQPITLDANGHFAVSGTFTTERPGPIRMDDPDTTQPARYSGQVEGPIMTLTVELSNGKESLGPYTLKANVYPRLVKCL